MTAVCTPSAHAADPGAVQALSEIVAALAVEGNRLSPPWRELESRLHARWGDRAEAAARPPGMQAASIVRHAALPVRAHVAGQSGSRPTGAWQIVAWGSPVSADAVSVRRSGPGQVNLESALQAAALRFVLDCETDSVRHYRLSAGGRRAGYAVQYGTGEILYFWSAPPDALLERDGCLIASANR